MRPGERDVDRRAAPGTELDVPVPLCVPGHGAEELPRPLGRELLPEHPAEVRSPPFRGSPDDRPRPSLSGLARLIRFDSGRLPGSTAKDAVADTGSCPWPRHPAAGRFGPRNVKRGHDLLEWLDAWPEHVHIQEDMGRTGRRAAFAVLVALALAVSALGPCDCLSTAGCHREAQQADAHPCCEKPAGVQAVADECCDDAPELVLASTEVPEVAPPTQQSCTAAVARSVGQLRSVDSTHAPPPHPPDRTTVLLI